MHLLHTSFHSRESFGVGVSSSGDLPYIENSFDRHASSYQNEDKTAYSQYRTNILEVSMGFKSKGTDLVSRA